MRRCVLAALLLVMGAAPGRGQALADAACFARALPADIRAHRLDDVKLLTGFVFDAAAAEAGLAPGAVIDRHTRLERVPGFGRVTKLDDLGGRYRVMRAPFNAGHGYFGVEIGALEPGGEVSSLFLVNRLFRLPVLLQQPGGVDTDIVTNGAMLAGRQTRAVTDANSAAAMALGDAERLKLPLLMIGQSQAGGAAQLQAAFLAARDPGRAVTTGFVTFNAAYVVASVRRLGLTPEQVGGINFSKDLDPGFGPHGLLPNRIGLQVYIHPDGSGGGTPGKERGFAAWQNPRQHYLSAFDTVSLAEALSNALDQDGARCSGGN